MGLPWPPTWLGGVACAVCEDVIFDGATPTFVYAFAQDISICPGMPGNTADPNRVIRMTQIPGFPCQWIATYIEGIYQYTYYYGFFGGNSFMIIQDISGFGIFVNTIPANCRDHFVNEYTCAGDPGAGFEAGTVDCFW